MSAFPEQKYTIEEYIEFLKTSDERFEYFDGEIISMAGGSVAHGDIAVNVLLSLSDKLKDRACRVMGSDMAIKTTKAKPFRFPDASVVCGERVIERMQGFDLLVNPLLIVEVLSKSTRAYDLNEKFLAYQAVESLKEYLLIDQTRPHVIRHVRQADGQWLRGDFIGMENSVRLESLDITLAFSEIYRLITFPAENSVEEIFD